MQANPCILSLSGDGFPNMLCGELSFSWKIDSKSGHQRAYELRVRKVGGADVWCSGRVESRTSASVLYDGPAFESNVDYEALVFVECDDDTSYTSDPVHFTSGLMDPEHEWHGAWLTSPYVSLPVAPVFRKTFSAAGKIERARLYICGLGYYELYVNGRQVGDRYMDPAWTVYDKRVNYVAYDVTDRLCEGNNAIGVCLGAGWYSSAHAKPRLVFTLQLMIEYADGSFEEICSRPDHTWLSLKETWMLENTLYIGEFVDARLMINDWADVDFDCSRGTWQPALLAEPPKGKLVPMRVEPIRCVKTISPVSITEPKPGVYIVDFGQNMAGIVELKLHCAQPGDEVTIRFSEILDGAGLLSTENLRKGQECDRYIARGGEEVYKPRFTYHGFRYAEVTGLRAALKSDDVLAHVMRTDVAMRSHFETSNALINDIQRICVWTENNNMHSVPTDCPQRDERLGWLNDLTVRLEEEIFNFAVGDFLKKVLQDIMDEQGKVTGAITDTAPYVNYGSQPADPVCSSYLLIPYLLYRHYGDVAVLEKAWNGIKAWTDYLASTCIDGIVGFSYYGDWAAPIGGNVRFSAGNGAVSAITPGGLMSTGFLYLNCTILAEIAEVIGKSEEKAYYTQLALETAQALNRTYLHADKGYYAGNSQASNVFMLYLGIVPPQARDKVIAHLVEDIRAHDTHTTTGNICSRYIYDVLADCGKIDLAYELATQTTYPSWGYMLSRGATTTWERWEYVDSGELVGMASHDHPMYSTISGWFYKYLAGIRATGAGFDSFEIRPFYPEKLEHVEATVATVKGVVSISWQQSGGRIAAQVEVPFNSDCTYTLTRLHRGEVLVDGVAARIIERDGFCAVELQPGKHCVEFELG